MGTLVLDCWGMSSGSSTLAILSGFLALGATLAVGVGLASVHWYNADGLGGDTVDVGLSALCIKSKTSILDPEGVFQYAVESCVSMADQVGFLEHVNSLSEGLHSKQVKHARQLWYGSISAIVLCALAIIGYVVLLAAGAFCATGHFLGDPEASSVVGKRGAFVGMLGVVFNVLGVGVGWFVVGRLANDEVGSSVKDIGWAAWVTASASVLGLASSLALYSHTRSSSQFSSSRLLPISSRGGRYTTFGRRSSPDY